MPAHQRFKTALLTAAILQGLSACTSLRSEEPPVCDGRHRRPANPYGSILVAPQQAQTPIPTAPGGAAEDDADGAGGCA